MKASRAPDYLPPPALRESSPPVPSELEVQALWFEQLYPPQLKTTDQRTVEIVQPGFWNHGGGPDFSRAALRFAGETDLRVGSVEVHLRDTDWHAHGHDADPAYNETVLHVVWEAGERSYFPATSAFRHVPQLVLGPQLIAPWPELHPLVSVLAQNPLPSAVPGKCAPLLAQLPSARVAEILRTAGVYRLRQKSRRWHWRQRLVGTEQALFEALAEALGFHANQIPLRLVAQRLPYARLRGLAPEERLALLFGVAGFLPGADTARLAAETRSWIRALWEYWWKQQDALAFAQLERAQWKLAGIRPLNRPERRLAALAQVVPLVPKLTAALREADLTRFSTLLLGIRDPFWEALATLSGPPLRQPCRLLGEERVQDIAINIFWPMVALHNSGAAQAGLMKMGAAPNHAGRIALQRLMLPSLSVKQRREALIQQGLLQIFRDYCLTDCSQCRDCTFPQLIENWSVSAENSDR